MKKEPLDKLLSNLPDGYTDADIERSVQALIDSEDKLFLEAAERMIAEAKTKEIKKANRRKKQRRERCK